MRLQFACVQTPRFVWLGMIVPMKKKANMKMRRKYDVVLLGHSCNVTPKRSTWIYLVYERTRISLQAMNSYTILSVIIYTYHNYCNVPSELFVLA